MPHNISEIQQAYNVLVSGIDEKAHSDDDDGGRAYGGTIRAAKGMLVEGMARNLVEVAWQELNGKPCSKKALSIAILAALIRPASNANR